MVVVAWSRAYVHILGRYANNLTCFGQCWRKSVSASQDSGLTACSGGTIVDHSPTVYVHNWSYEERVGLLLVNQVENVVEAQRMRIVQMLLQGATYGLPGSDGKVIVDFLRYPHQRLQ